MGDFWGWGEAPAQRVFQGITRLMNSGEGKAVYDEAFRRIPALIDGTDPDVCQIDESLTPLRHGVELVEQGRIIRTEIGFRLVQYIVPLTVVPGLRRAAYRLVSRSLLPRLPLGGHGREMARARDYLS